MFKIKTKLFCIDLLWKTHFSIPLARRKAEISPSTNTGFTIVTKGSLFFLFLLLLQIGQKERRDPPTLKETKRRENFGKSGGGALDS